MECIGKYGNRADDTLELKNAARMEKKDGMASGILAKTNVNDSIFTNLFKLPKYTLQLYKALHPEDDTVTEDEIKIVTLENILLNQSYNDLGFTVGNRLLVLCEAQSTWSVNILVCVLIYVAQTIQEHIVETKQNVYSNRKVTFPEPEFYVIYTGDRKECPERLRLSEEFFGGREGSVDVQIKMIYDGKQGDILNQYIAFTKIYKEQYKLYGRTQKTVLETIRICEDENVLKEYLESRKKEVVDIMMTLFNKDYIMEAYTEEMKQEGEMKKAKETAINLADMGLAPEKIAQAVKVSVETVKQWLAGGVSVAK